MMFDSEFTAIFLGDSDGFRSVVCDAFVYGYCRQLCLGELFLKFAQYVEE